MPFVNDADQDDGSHSNHDRQLQLTSAFREATDFPPPVHDGPVDGPVPPPNYNDHYSDLISVELRINLAARIHPYTALVVRNLYYAQVPPDYICQWCQLTTEVHMQVALKCAEELSFVEWSTGLDRIEERHPMADRCYWTFLKEYLEEVNIAEYPGLTEAILNQYGEYVNDKYLSVMAAGLNCLPVETEYKYFYTGRNFDDLETNRNIKWKYEAYRILLNLFYEQQKMFASLRHIEQMLDQNN